MSDREELFPDKFITLDDNPAEDIALNENTARGIQDRQALYRQAKEGAKQFASTATAAGRRAALSVYSMFNQAKGHISNWISHQTKAAVQAGANIKSMIREHDKHKKHLSEKLKSAKLSLSAKAQHASGFLGIHELVTGVKHAGSGLTRSLHKHTSKALAKVSEITDKAAKKQAERYKDAQRMHNSMKSEMRLIQDAKKEDALLHLEKMHQVVEMSIKHVNDVKNTPALQNDPTAHSEYADASHTSDTHESEIADKAHKFVHKLKSQAAKRTDALATQLHVSVEGIGEDMDDLFLEPIGIQQGDAHHHSKVDGHMPLPSEHHLSDAGVPHDVTTDFLSTVKQAIYAAHHGENAVAEMQLWALALAIQSQMAMLLATQHAAFAHIDKVGLSVAFEKVATDHGTRPMQSYTVPSQTHGSSNSFPIYKYDGRNPYLYNRA